MGFIPIFITLGGFIFLFVMVVHQNLKNKKKVYQNHLNQLVDELIKIDPSLGAEFQPANDLHLEVLERQYYRLKNQPSSTPTGESQVLPHNLLVETKRSRYEYNRLFRTKPYSLVASLMGHSEI